MSDPTPAEARTREIAGYLVGLAKVYRAFPHAELWGHTSQAEYAAALTDEASEMLIAFADQSKKPDMTPAEFVEHSIDQLQRVGLVPQPPAADAGEVRTYREGVEREAKAIWMALEGRFLADEWQDAVWAGTSKSTILNLPEEDILAEDGSVYDSPVKKFGRASYMAAAAAIRKLGS